jgi:hypothetical protein
MMRDAGPIIERAVDARMEARLAMMERVVERVVEEEADTRREALAELRRRVRQLELGLAALRRRGGEEY